MCNKSPPVFLTAIQIQHDFFSSSVSCCMCSVSCVLSSASLLTSTAPAMSSTTAVRYRYVFFMWELRGGSTGKDANTRRRISRMRRACYCPGRRLRLVRGVLALTLTIMMLRCTTSSAPAPALGLPCRTPFDSRSSSTFPVAFLAFPRCPSSHPSSLPPFPMLPLSLGPTSAASSAAPSHNRRALSLCLCCLPCRSCC